MAEAALKLRELELMREKERLLCKKSFAQFFRSAWHVVEPGTPLKWNWHIDLISEYLEAVYYRQIKKIIINMPPRFMKSNLVTVCFPAWGLGIDPANKFICASYSSTLSTKHSVDTRLIVSSPWYKRVFPATQLAPDQNEKSKFQTSKRGHRIATSVGGTATGEGGDFLILDDPINPKMAMSDTERNNTNEWIDQTWSSRKNDPKTAVEIVVMQRLHVKDPTGKLLSEDDGWTQLIIPQEAERDQIINFPRSKKTIKRKQGELLHPSRVGKTEIDSFKKRLGSYGYAAQQQQQPSPAGGGIVKLAWFNRYSVAPTRQDGHKIVISIDSAVKDKEINDPSVAGVWLVTETNYYLLHVWRDRVVYPDLKHKVISLADKFKPDEILIEDKASGQQLLQDFRRDTSLAVIAMDPSGQGDKVVRMSNVTPTIEAGNCWLPEQALWLFDYESEIENFPNGEHDDQVDMTSQFLRRMKKDAEVFIW